MAERYRRRLLGYSSLRASCVLGSLSLLLLFLLLLLLGVALDLERGAGVQAAFFYSKYPLEDTYARDCDELAETSGGLPFIEVRNFSPRDGRDRGTLNPYDLDVAGWCGSVGGAGQRQAYLLFDVTDFTASAVAAATFKITFYEFPVGARMDLFTCSTGWFEEQVMWVDRPTLGENITSCVFEGDDLDVTAQASSVQCDVTAEVQATAGSDLCIAAVETVDGGSQQAIRFFSKDYDEVNERTGEWEFDSNQGSTSLEHGTVVGVEDTWKPHIIIQGTPTGVFPEHLGKS